MVTVMLKLLLGVVIEVFIAVSLAGAILGLLIPALRLSQAVGKGDVRVIVAVVGVLLARWLSHCSGRVARFIATSNAESSCAI